MGQINNFFYRKFDELTMTKLFIFEKYVENWIPVFLKQKVDYIYIFDFFAGIGYDSQNNPGSPIRIINQIKSYQSIIYNTKIILFFNEYKKKNFEKLKSNCDNYLKKNPSLNKIIEIKYSNQELENIFSKLENRIGEYPSLVFMDQFGVKYSNYIAKFKDFKTTDFLIFISSSYLRRFAKTPEFKGSLNLTDEDIEKLIKVPYKLIHEAILQFLKERLPKNSSIKLYPFSLKKGGNIHGLIFGAKHPLAVDKFLKIVWKVSPENGSANYDIYNNYEKKQLNLFPEFVNKTTIESFQEKLEEEILKGRIETNEDAYNYTLENGHIDKHANEVLKKLKKQGKINYNSKSPLINYENVVNVKKRRIIKYEQIKN